MTPTAEALDLTPGKSGVQSQITAPQSVPKPRNERGERRYTVSGEVCEVCDVDEQRARGGEVSER